jgi:intracellular septation protein
MTQLIALAVAAAAAIALSWFWRPRQAMDRGVRVLLACYAVLGLWALWFGLFAVGREPAAFAHWKPTVLYWLLSAVLLAAPPLGWGYPVKAVFGTYFIFSAREWRWINISFAVLCAILGSGNLVIALAYTQDDWEGFKWSCMVNLVAVFLLRLAFVWLDASVRIGAHLHARAKALLRKRRQST